MFAVIWIKKKIPFAIILRATSQRIDWARSYFYTNNLVLHGAVHGFLLQHHYLELALAALAALDIDGARQSTITTAPSAVKKAASTHSPG